MIPAFLGCVNFKIGIPCAGCRSKSDLPVEIEYLTQEAHMSMRLFPLPWRFGFLVLALIAGCRSAQKPVSSPEWDKYVNGYLDAYFTVHPDIAVTEGRHEFDGKLPDFSATAWDK